MKPVNIAPRTYGKPEEIVFDLPEKVLNSTMTEPLDTSKFMHPSGLRPGCDQHLQYRSRGIGC